MNKCLMRFAIKKASGIATAKATISQNELNQLETDVATSAKSYVNEIAGIDIASPPFNESVIIHFQKF